MNEWWLISVLVLIAFSASVLITYPLKANKTSSICLALVMFLLVATGYYFWGDFFSWQDFIHQQESQQRAQQVLRSIKSPQELIDKLKAKLDNNPQSAKGWYLLGRLYTSQNDPKNAFAAFARAHDLAPEKEQYTVNYAHSLWLLNNQQFNPQLLELFKNLLIKNPRQPDALAMLAMNAYMSHAYQEAILYWQQLLVMAPSQSEESLAIRKAIAKAQHQINLGSKKNDR